MSNSIRDYAITPVSFTNVSIDDRFWHPRIETAVKVTVPYDFQKCEETGRIDNFAKAGGLMDSVEKPIQKECKPKHWTAKGSTDLAK